MNNIIGHEKKDCCGCTACMNICPKNAIIMEKDSEGFYYPSIDIEKCIQCGLCKKVCPIRFRDENLINNMSKKIYAAKNNDPNIVLSSSSGGMFGVLVKFVINHGGIVFGAQYDENFNVIHSYSETIKECKKYSRSKYVQSDLNRCYSEVKEKLDNNILVLFTGTPCQVQGLKLYLRKDYNNLITCDIVCHGVPSPKVFRDYLNFLCDKYKSQIVDINMKFKKYGWEKPVIKIEFDNGRKIINTKETRLWTEIFFEHYATRLCCHDCRFANFNRPGDITIGDFWGIPDSHPNFYDYNGVSLLLINNKKGNMIFNKIKDQITYIESCEEKAIQPNLKEPSKPSDRRDEFWNDYSKVDFKKIAYKYLDYNIISIIKSRIKEVLEK